MGTWCVLAEIRDGIETTVCAADCTADGRCLAGETCYWSGYPGDVLACFPGGADPLGAGCTYPTNCEAGLACTSGGPAEGVCTPFCTLAPCLEGDACLNEEDCDADLACAILYMTDAGYTGRCVRECESPDRARGVPALCPTGGVCFLASASPLAPWACFPGGTTPAGAPCETFGECERGTGCWLLMDVATCVPVCNDHADCVSPRTCRDGLCLP
jgi:hypothetical protein